MALDLAQRLLGSEALPQRAVEGALLRHCKEGIPFVKALLELYPQFAGVVAQELDQAVGPVADDIAPEQHLLSRLPDGTCGFFLGFPIGVTGSTGVVDVLTVDPLDSHAASELAHHLGAPVRLVRGRMEFILREIAAVDGPAAPNTAPQDQSHMNDALGSEVASGAPIPLTRLAPGAVQSQVQPGTARGVAPQAAIQRVGSRSTLPPIAVRVSAETQTHVEKEEAPASEGDEKVSLLAPSSDELQLALSDLAVAEDPDAVVHALVSGLSRIADEVFVFTIRGGTFACRARKDDKGRAAGCANLRIDGGADALARCIELGQYLGPLDGEAAETRFLAAAYDEVCSTRIDVSERPTLVLFAAGFKSAYDVSLRSDHLARAASDALARIVLAKKR